MAYERVFLGGGGDEKQSFIIDSIFTSSLKRGTILYIPVAMEPENSDYGSCLKWFRETMGQHDILPPQITMWTDIVDKTVSEFCSFSAIYIGGGMTGRLCRLLRNSKFVEALPRFFKQGGALYGGSAGAIVLGTSLQTVPEEIESGGSSEGLAIFPTLSFRCHFNPDDTQAVSVIEAAQKKGVNKILGIPENSGIVIENEKLKVLGTDPVYFFNGSSLSSIAPNNFISVG